MENSGRATTRLRYRFNNLPQARAHLRDAEDRWLLFYREEKLRLLPCAPVCLELGFDDGSAARLLHGEVHRSLEGSGTWLEILDPRPLLSTNEHTRKSRRLGCDLPIEVRSEGRIDSGRLLDVSAGGARLAGLDPLPLGQPVELRLLSPDRLTFRDLSFGSIAWAETSEQGVRFDPADSIGRSAIARLIKEMESRWQNAWESAHPRFCCKSKGVIEPEPPLLRLPDNIVIGQIAL